MDAGRRTCAIDNGLFRTLYIGAASMLNLALGKTVTYDDEYSTFKQIESDDKYLGRVNNDHKPQVHKSASLDRFLNLK